MDAHLEHLIAEQAADDVYRTYPDVPKSRSLDSSLAGEDGGESNVGEELVGYDPWDAIDDALDGGQECSYVFAENVRTFDGGKRAARGADGCRPWDVDTLNARHHPFRDTPQIKQAYGHKWHRPRVHGPELPVLRYPELVRAIFYVRCLVELGYVGIKSGRGNKPPAETRVLRRFAFEYRVAGWPTWAIVQATGRRKSAVSSYVKSERDQRERLLATLTPPNLSSPSGIQPPPVPARMRLGVMPGPRANLIELPTTEDVTTA
jgi:hypothetical protein